MNVDDKTRSFYFLLKSTPKVVITNILIVHGCLLNQYRAPIVGDQKEPSHSKITSTHEWHLVGLHMITQEPVTSRLNQIKHKLSSQSEHEQKLDKSMTYLVPGLSIPYWG